MSEFNPALPPSSSETAERLGGRAVWVCMGRFDCVRGRGGRPPRPCCPQQLDSSESLPREASQPARPPRVACWRGASGPAIVQGISGRDSPTIRRLPQCQARDAPPLPSGSEAHSKSFPAGGWGAALRCGPPALQKPGLVTNSGLGCEGRDESASSQDCAEWGDKAGPSPAARSGAPAAQIRSAGGPPCILPRRRDAAGRSSRACRRGTARVAGPPSGIAAMRGSSKSRRTLNPPADGGGGRRRAGLAPRPARRGRDLILAIGRADSGIMMILREKSLAVRVDAVVRRCSRVTGGAVLTRARSGGSEGRGSAPKRMRPTRNRSLRRERPQARGPPE